jgi:hypothetical protein
MMARIFRTASKVLGLFAIVAANSHLGSSACTREGLLAAASKYIEAQTSAKHDGLGMSATNFTYRQNNKVADIKTGILSQPLKIDLNRSTADTVACASYTMLISSSGSKPYVIATQLRHDGDNTDVITMVDSIVATTGSLFFNAARTLGYLKAQNWGTIEESKRPSRELLKKYGDGYLDMWTDRNAADSMEWGADCERVEGSQFTKPCGRSLPKGGSTKKNGMRRYVIDETVGSVDVLCSFDSLGDYPDSHEIRVEDNKVKYVHTVTD